MHQSVRDYWIAFNDPLEGRVDFMYLDQKGWVSTGIGNKIDETVQENSPPSHAEREASLAAANELGWQVGSGGPAATQEDVASAWDAVKARLDLAPHGHRAFEGLTGLRLDNSEIDRHVYAKLDQMESFLITRAPFAQFSTWSANAQLATLSMCWALGPNFHFPLFEGWVAERDWNAAAEECHFTPDIGTIRIRNMLDRSHFLLARIVEDQGLPGEQMALYLSDAFGVQGALLVLGYKPGLQDGDDGPNTQGAVMSFQGDNGLDQNGAFNDPNTVSALGARLAELGFTVL
ncbi:peptidoglycan-binding protein [Streptomyces sp. NPDC056452]|uniref:peptidoglycan-binding domain-containing protein n=1 Tax=Streptomyces sp. NPDC056452 TaxID=3345821 RepID=UPI00368260EF